MLFQFAMNFLSFLVEIYLGKKKEYNSKNDLSKSYKSNLDQKHNVTLKLVMDFPQLKIID